MAKKKASAKSKGGGRKSAAKGGGYEKWCAKELSLWITNDSTEDAVWRSAASGARATMRARGGDTPEVHIGDLMPVLPEANEFFATYAVECKRVRALQWRAMFKPDIRCNIREFWNQAVAQSVGRVPLLFMKEDNGVDLVVAPAPVIREVEIPLSEWVIGMEPVSITPLSGILTNVTPLAFIRAAEVVGFSYEK